MYNVCVSVSVCSVSQDLFVIECHLKASNSSRFEMKPRFVFAFMQIPNQGRERKEQLFLYFVAKTVCVEQQNLKLWCAPAQSGQNMRV